MSDAPAVAAAEDIAEDAVAEIAPVSIQERISSLDFIRGIAVMGILAANIVAFGQPTAAYMFPEAFLTPHGETSEWLLIAQFVLIDGKMRALFTLLFGAGMYLFMERTWARGGTRWRQMWRLFALLLFGLIHFFLIWYGDILMYYALIGFVVVPCLKWAAKTQFVMGLLGYISGAILYAAMLSMPYLAADTSMGETAPFLEMRDGMNAAKDVALKDSAVEAELIQSGDYGAQVAHRVSEHWADPIGNVLLFALETLPLMLLGVALYRMGFFSGGFSSRKMRLWGWIGLAVGAAWYLGLGLWLKSVGFTYYAMLAAFVGWTAVPQFLMMLGMAALMVEYSSGWNGWFAERVRAAGRAAFTNYIGTSIVLLFVFQGWALGLFGELTRPQLYIVMLFTCGLMLVWSKPWLDRYRYGPLEWLWRCLTYGKIFPLKR
ncbi:DUF418 domain-containing protein [Erythrobacter sp. F6033]|uniref:DUF418 domain-containing protein n=1 Tax=Erythrobacter sp. F6033 TaxID=2926401 RepID=UPI001FF5E528|nr:DUF418 domain-containing protein [Erythrobacter sp. F6033]MCK0129167.1 DUF418 domain-containing protein [Erythrobacter sp. F6033]